MNDSVADLKNLFLKILLPPQIGWDDEAGPKARKQYLGRKLICTPYGGNYRKTAGWVICVEGSPPKGTLIVPGDGPNDMPAIYFNGVVTKELRGIKQNAIVQAFFDEHLQGKSKPFMIV